MCTISLLLLYDCNKIVVFFSAVLIIVDSLRKRNEKITNHTSWDLSFFFVFHLFIQTDYCLKMNPTTDKENGLQILFGDW